jgi:hypothetical protein
MRTKVKLLLPILCLLLGSMFSACGSHQPITTPPPEYADFLTVKYDTNGNQVWANLYEQSENSSNHPAALNLDDSGNVYVTGTTVQGATGGYSTIKYNSSGERLFTISSRALSNPYIAARAAIVDSAGNIFITGTSTGTDIQNETVTLKYDAKGHRVWETRYIPPGSEFSGLSAIILDKAGNVYAIGSIHVSVTNDDFLTVKYDSGGNLLWASTYDSPVHKMDIAFKLAADDNGNVYVTGESLKEGQFGYDYATVKYDSNGRQLWVVGYNGPGNSLDVPHDLKLDAQGNVVVTGESDGSDGMREYATIKYNSDGQELWISRYDGPDGAGSMPSAMAIDSEGNVYVTGESSNRPNGSDYATIKYGSDGQELWVARYKGTGSGLNGASALFVDNKGNVCVTGQGWLDSQYATYDTVKYDPSGKQVWVAKYNKVYFTDRPTGIAVDRNDNVFITGPVSHFSPRTY